MTADESQTRIDFSQAHVVSERLKVLSNSDRLKILCVLVDNEMNVQQIELQTDIHQPTLSQQLTVLRKPKWSAHVVKASRFSISFPIPKYSP